MDWAKYNGQFQKAKQMVDWGLKYGFRIVYVDETYFTSKNFQDFTFNSVNKMHSI